MTAQFTKTADLALPSRRDVICARPCQSRSHHTFKKSGTPGQCLVSPSSVCQFSPLLLKPTISFSAIKTTMRLKCCVGGCKATNDTHRLFVFPKKDLLRNLWMSFLVPTNPLLLGLSKGQLLSKRVCEKHFDKHQFDVEGKRIRFSYPCLFTDNEITYGEPLAAVGTVRNALSDHNYFKDQDDEDDTLIIVDKTLVIGRPGEDFQEHPSGYLCSYSQVKRSLSDNKASCKILTSGYVRMTSHTCCVPRCDSNRKHIRLHEIAAKSRKKWIMAILSKCPDINTEELEMLKSSKFHYVCHKHFEKKFFTRTMRIKNGCVPTLFTEREIETGVPNVDPKTCKTHSLLAITLQKGEVHADHAYALPNGKSPTGTADAAASLNVQSALQEDKEDEPAFEEDNQIESNSRLPTDEVMMDYIIEHPADSRDIFETIGPEDPKATVFSWERTELLEAVPMCKSTTIKTPEKLFVFVPRKKQIREQWLTLARRDRASLNETSNSYYCEDHFDLPYDMENYLEYTMGYVSQMRMRPGCVPSKFDCQPNRDNISSNFLQTPKKRQRLDALIEGCKKELDENITEIEKPQNSENLCIVVPCCGPSTCSDDPEDESVLVPETKIPEDVPTLSMFCDEPDKPPVGITPSKPEAEAVPEDVVYRCVDCAVVVDGFSFWCVQCLCGVLCGACAQISPHDIHYVLRAPKGASLCQTQPVLLVIREQLQKDNLLTLYGTEVDGVKVEMKLEPEEPASPAAPATPPDSGDPLALETHSHCYMNHEHENVESNSDAVEFSGEGVETQSEAVRFYEEGAEPHPEEPQTADAQISLEGVDSHSEAVQFYLDGVESHPEAVQFYLEAVGPDNEARDLRLYAIADKRVNKETIDHHPFKRSRRMEIRPSDQLNLTTNPKTSDVQYQTLIRIPPTMTSQTVLRLPNTLPSHNTGSHILLSKSSPTKLSVPQNVHEVSNILKRLNTNKVELRKSTRLKQDNVQNIAKGSLLRTLLINPKGSPIQVSQNVGLSELKVTSGPRCYETVSMNSDDSDIEFLDEEFLARNDIENEVDSGLHKENQDEDRIGEELSGDIESELGNDDLEDRIDELDTKNRDDDKSDESELDDEESKDSSKDKESEIDDDDLDEDFRIDEQEQDQDSTDES